MAASPIDLLSSPQSTQMLPPDPAPDLGGGGQPQQGQQPQQQGQAPSPQDQVQLQGGNGLDQMLDQAHQGKLQNVLSSIGNLLSGGGDNVTISRDDDGKIQIQRQPMSTGQKWGRIASTALQGMAAGYAVPNGPGNLGRAAAAGTGTGIQQAQQQKQQQMDQANQDFDARQKAQLHNANMAVLNQNLARGAFQLGQDKVQAADGAADRQNAIGTRLLSNPNNKDLGVASPADLPKLLSTYPDAVKNHVKGQIVAEPEVDDNGQYTGKSHYYYMDQDWKSQRNTEAVTQHYLAPGDKIGDDPQIKTRVIPANAMTNGDIELASQAEGDKIVQASVGKQERLEKARSDASEAALRRSEGAKNYAEAGKAGAETAQLQSGPDSLAGVMGAKMVEGTMDPSQLSKRSKSYDSAIKAADDYSQAKYGKPFDMAQAAGDFKFANQPQTQNTLKYLHSLAGDDGKSGNLAELVKQSAATKRTSYPPLNDVNAWTKLMSGNPQMAAYHATALEVADQVGKILSGGGSGGTSDMKLKQAQDLFNTGFSHEQIKGVAGALGPLLNNRKQGLIGNNRYLQRQYNAPGGTQQPAQAPVSLQSQGVPAPAPAGAQAEVHDASGKLIGHAVNGRYVALGAQ